MERRGVATDLGDLTPRQQFRRTQDQLAAVTGLDPAGLAFEPHRTRAERNPARLAEDQLAAVLIAGDQVPILRSVVLDRRRAIADCPLTEVDAVRTPLQHATADQATALFEVEAIEQLRIERTPCRRPEVHVPVHNVLIGSGFRHEPAAHHGLHPGGVSEDLLERTEPPRAGQFTGEREVRQVATLGPRLKHAPRAAHRLSQDQALRNVLRDRLLAVHVLARAGGIHRHRAVPVRPRGDQHGIDVFPVEHLAEVAVHRTVFIAIFRVGDLLDRHPALLLHIAHRDELHIGLLQETAQVIRSPVADPNPADHHPLAGSHSSIQTECGTGDNHRSDRSSPRDRQRRLEKGTPRNPRCLL